MSEAAVAVQQGVSDTQGDVWRKKDLPPFMKHGHRVANVMFDGQWHHGMSITGINADEYGVRVTVIGSASDSVPKDVYYSREAFRPYR